MPPSPPSQPAVAPPDEGTSFGAWTLVWCLYLTKLATIVIIVLMQHSYDVAVFVTITTWFWFGPMIALGAGPLLYRIRLRRVRRRRAALERAEWDLSLDRPIAELDINTRR
jgi:hypothetical protein